ncbi:DUF350 domain-containing protein [Deinococcus peraridilitoris]|uniref:Putative membrane protein n=1 Tax=Deinococcus peraridilitoris (strain DSM 19664 / LMG 22246 / CIP 109416 / KR-200) TaxID=937777 RepID=L0A1B8_DEIPD|nr:DUF350 domain-containing protein [Deinococcus peraridilitoris]AFZ67683.1 putative membrane protein [Deinococcus peraridilitoris DSM 19664]
MLEATSQTSILLLTILYAILGLALLILGYWIVDRFTPTDAQKKIFEEGNVAVAILMGSFVLGLALVIAAAMTG